MPATPRQFWSSISEPRHRTGCPIFAALFAAKVGIRATREPHLVSKLQPSQIVVSTSHPATTHPQPKAPEPAHENPPPASSAQGSQIVSQIILLPRPLRSEGSPHLLLPVLLDGNTCNDPGPIRSSKK